MCNIAVLVSGGGTNLQALIDAERSGIIKNGRIVCVISSNPEAYALTRAENAGIATAVVSRKEFASADEYDDALLAELDKHDVQLIVLAGFMSIIGTRLISRYPRAIINVHPSLIPSFCGKGCYGLRVHQMALDYGVKVTGATVHFVNEIPDGGEIILQKAVDILPGDTPEILQKRVMEQAEWQILPKAVSLFCEGEL
jgi:phosphoribosylglycinamide formyltransferase-1